MKYLKLFSIIFLFNIANIGYSETPKVPVPYKYLYQPIKFTNSSKEGTTTFEKMFKDALDQLDLKPSEITTISNYAFFGSKAYYPRILMLSDLDYNASRAEKMDIGEWNTIQSNSWSAMPDNVIETNMSLVGFPCGVADFNSLGIDNPKNRPVNRAQELSYFCFPIKDAKKELSFALNTMQSYINKSYTSTRQANPNIGSGIMKPMFMPANITTYLSPSEAVDSNNNPSCDTANAYVDGSNVVFWGFPFRGQQCEDTKLENLYFMIIE